MAVFVCKVIDHEGRRQELQREAENQILLIRELTSKGLYPISCREMSISVETKRWRFKIPVIIEFTDTIAMMLNSGLSLKDALSISRTIFIKGKTALLMETISARLSRGDSLHSSLSGLNGSFPEVYLGLVKIGEKTGSLESIMKRLSSYLQDQKKLREKLLTSIMYPIMVLSLAIIGSFLSVFILFPKIRDIFLQLGPSVNTQMEKSMKIMSTTINVSVIFFILMVISVILFIIVRKRGGKSAQSIDKIVLKIPFLGQIAKEKELLNLNFALETLVGNGVPLEEALTEAQKVLGNNALKVDLASIKEKIIKGENLSDAFLEHPLFPKRLGQWIAIGERTGEVEKVFKQLKTYYQNELEKTAARFMTIIEPVLILVTGLIIIMIIIVFIIPIFTMYGSVF